MTAHGLSSRGQDATLERLRADRQLEETLHNEKTAMRCADSARALLHHGAEQRLR
ncbi:hypothetical protein [Streptomyces sp. NPDC059209]|uniref:hypothetical protein n=1 Tax=Streptomyces sp. NPDC059209 TaxID=3346769 RepID=UPI0036974A07